MPIYVSYAVFVLIFNTLFFGETLTGTQLLSFAVIFGGGLFLSIETFGLSAMKYRDGALHMLPAVIILAISITLFNQSLSGLDFVSAFVLDMGGFALAGSSLLLIPTWHREIRAGIRSASLKKFKLFLVNDTIDLSGQLAYKYALMLAPAASLVAAINGIQPFYVLVLGLLFTIFLPHIIKEDVTTGALLQKMIGVVVIGLGIVLLELG